MISPIQNSKKKFNNYILNLIDNKFDFKFSNDLDSNSYALCFGIHSLFLIKDDDTLNKYRDIWVNKLLINIKNNNLSRNQKPFLQLLSLTLSSLIILNSPKHQIIHDYCLDSIYKDTNKYLKSIGSDYGKPGSGNLAMFLAIFYIYLETFYKYDFSNSLSEWKKFHQLNENNFSLWSKNKSINSLKYSYFQNGYHQYEIYNYFKISLKNKDNLIRGLSNLSDHRGQFAPYPGGGGCYDYDAVYILTMISKESNLSIKSILNKTLNSILLTQNYDGGFGESIYIRPINISNLIIQLCHISIFKKEGKNERLSRFLALLRPKHNLIKTHWSDKKRSWSESNIFNSWFRMMTLARIEIFNDKEKIKDWNFLNFPGIGFHEQS